MTASLTLLLCSILTPQRPKRECGKHRARPTAWSNSRLNSMSAFVRPTANWLQPNPAASCSWKVPAPQPSSRTKSGTLFLLASRRWRQTRLRQSASGNRDMPFSRATALEYLRRACEQNRLAPAYLISGPPGSGKEKLAADLASLVNGTPAAEVFSAGARDILIARPESKSRRIVIEQIRDLEHALQLRASNGRRKVAIVADADRLQPQA